MADDIDIKDCCKEESNLESTQVTEDLIVRTCQVCGCRHFEFEVDTAVLGAMGASL